MVLAFNDGGLPLRSRRKWISSFLFPANFDYGRAARPPTSGESAQGVRNVQRIPPRNSRTYSANLARFRPLFLLPALPQLMPHNDGEVHAGSILN